MFNTKTKNKKDLKMEMILKVSTREDAEQALEVLKGFISSLVPQAKVKKEKVIEAAKVEEPEVEEASKTKVKKEVKLSVKDIQELAKKAVAATTKEETKAIISKYGVNISSIDESDYESLVNDLEALIEEV
jgi:hypothetical protein